MYRIDPKNVLGRGAYGVVYGGVSTRSPKRVVAIKVMLKKDNLEHAGDLKGICSTREQDIDKELEILRQLEHPNIIKFHTFVKGTDGVYYIVMEKADGGDLLHRIVTSGSFIEKEARNTCGTILNALKYIHNKGIAHRDLKPENLLLVGKGNKSVIKIADFGLANYSDDSRNYGWGSLTTQCGTLQYVSPEILNDDPYYGTKTDMWSFGVILYYLLVGQFPFVGKDTRELKKNIREGKFEFDEECFSQVSKGAKELIRSLLTVDPRSRFSAQKALDSDWKDEILENYDLNNDRLRRSNAKRILRASVWHLIAANKFLVNPDLMLRPLTHTNVVHDQMQRPLPPIVVHDLMRTVGTYEVNVKSRNVNQVTWADVVRSTPN